MFMFIADGSMSKMATNTDAKSSLADINSQYSSSGTIVELKRSLGLAGGSSVIIGTIIGGDITTRNHINPYNAELFL